jgi:hypothetical protein
VKGFQFQEGVGLMCMDFRKVLVCCVWISGAECSGYIEGPNG